MGSLSRRGFITQTGMASMIAGFPALRTNFPPISPSRKLRIALCGLGRYANMLADGFKDSAQCELAGIITGTPAKAEAWKKKYRIPEKNIYNYQNFDSIATNTNIDVVYVVLPNSMHREYTIRAAKAGKHVIVEKPMAIHAADCEAMIDACKKAGVQLAVGYRLHFEPYNMEMKRLGQEKVFGAVRLIEASLSYNVNDPTEWRLHKAMSGGGPLMNLGVYCLQASRYITGEEPLTVTAQFGPNTNPTLFSEVEASISWQLEFPGGAVANCSSAYNCNTDRLFAAAEKGFFELSPAISYGPFKGRTSAGDIKKPDINQQAAQLDGIATHILAGQLLPSHISGEEGLRDARILDAIYLAAASGSRMKLANT